MNGIAYTISPLGDSALLISFGNIMDDTLNKHVLWLFKLIKSSTLPVTDVVPAYSSLAVYYDTASLHQQGKSAFELMKKWMEPFLSQEGTEENILTRSIKIPVCYATRFAPDLAPLALQKKLSVQQIVQLHTLKSYGVSMIGFLPGFPYMGKVDERIAMVRKPVPVNVVAGSVGIAGEQTGIYPLNSPGGWQIIGRTPLKIFDSAKEDAVLLQPGDEVIFYSITEDEFKNY